MAPEAVPSLSLASPLAILIVPRQGSPQDAKAKAGMEEGDGKGIGRGREGNWKSPGWAGRIPSALPALPAGHNGEGFGRERAMPKVSKIRQIVPKQPLKA